MKTNKTRLDIFYIDLDTSFGEDFSEYDFNEQNIPLVRFNRSKNWQHNPVTVCQYGLHQYNLHLRTNNAESEIKFLNQANWLIKNYEIGPNKSAIWYYNIDIPFYKLQRKWICRNNASKRRSTTPNCLSIMDSSSAKRTCLQIQC